MVMGIPALRGTGAIQAPAPARAPWMSGVPSVGAFSPQDLMTPEELMSSAAAGPMDMMAAPQSFDENLAVLIADESYLDRLATDIIEQVENDIRSRRKWVETMKRGASVLGITHFAWQKGEAPFKGASSVVHPVLCEAGMQSMARAVEELMPAKGPVKTEVMGVEDKEKRASADRIQDHMNYQVMIEDEAYQKETNKLHLYNGWFGCAYRKAFHDPILDRNVLRFCRADEIILPYSATCIETSPRITHRFKLSNDDFKRYIASDEYREIAVQEPNDSGPDEVQQVIDETDNKEPVEDDDDIDHTIYEVDIKLNLKGLEDTDRFGRKSGLALPYTVSIEKDSSKIMAIRRCWKESDPLKNRRTRYAEYSYLPGLGVYGFGLLHLIGSLGEAATDTLRALLDSATFANLQGGFKSKDAAFAAGELELTPGVWKDVNASADELSKAFYTPPFREPSEALFKLLGYLTDLARRFASTTDLQVGEGSNKAPVGTTIAMIEQGQKLYSSVHKRGHASVGVELRMLFELNQEHIPEEGYKYTVPGDDRVVYRKDYDNAIVSAVPVSDPNIFSQTQRIAQGQALYQMWRDDPTGWKGYEVKRRVCDALKIPAIDDVLVDTEKGPEPMDPVSENIAMLTQRPVKAHEGENHLAHMAVHMAFIQHPQFGGIPQAHDMIAPPLIAHMAEHLGLYYADVNRKMGVPIPAINLSAQPGDPMSEQQSADPNQIAAMAAQMLAQFMQTSGISVPVDQGAQDQAKADVRLTDAQSLAAFATAVKTFMEAGQTLQVIESGLATLDPALNAAAGANGQPGPSVTPSPSLPVGGSGAPAAGAISQ